MLFPKYHLFICVYYLTSLLRAFFYSFFPDSGLAFMLGHERLALLTTTVYSVYCAWTYVGWLGLILAFYLSFISSDILMFFLKNSINQRRSNRPPEQSAGMEGQPGFFNSESFHASFSETSPGFSSDHSPGVPSTSGTDSELTSEEEVIRLLNCTDHYSVLGLSRYENVDVSFLKREYRKKVYDILCLLYICLSDILVR